MGSRAITSAPKLRSSSTTATRLKPTAMPNGLMPRSFWSRGGGTGQGTHMCMSVLALPGRGHSLRSSLMHGGACLTALSLVQGIVGGLRRLPSTASRVASHTLAVVMLSCGAVAPTTALMHKPRELGRRIHPAYGRCPVCALLHTCTNLSCRHVHRFLIETGTDACAYAREQLAGVQLCHLQTSVMDTPAVIPQLV